MGKWAPRALGVVITVLCLVGAGRFLWPQPGIEEHPASTQRQLAFVRTALDRGADTDAQRLFPEGYVFANVLYGLAWVQAAHTDPALRDRAVAEARRALARTESAEGRAVFSPELRPANGVFWAGWTNWLRGAILTLDRTDPAEQRLFSARSEEIARAFEAAGTPFLPAYPGQAWPVDSTVALASLRLHDRLLGDRFGPVVQRWLREARARLDPATGLLPHRVSPTDGSPLKGARATSQTVIARFLPEIDAGFAAEQYARYRSEFVSFPAGFGPGLREFPRGAGGAGDVDSGPLIAGVSLSATVVALGAARVNGDAALASALGAEGELLGVPVDLPGGKRYALGLLPIGDAFVVWSSTARPLVAGAPAATGALPGWWRAPWLSVLALIGLAPWVRPLVRRLSASRPTTPRPAPPVPSPAPPGGR
ncbi:hypothetical protein ACWEVD_11910 [Nocardia thailandica]